MNGFKGTQQKGRTSGNKSNTRIKESFAALVEANLDRLQYDLDQLESKDRLRFIIDLAAYVIPKMRSVETSNELTHENFTPINWKSFFENVNIEK